MSIQLRLALLQFLLITMVPVTALAFPLLKGPHTLFMPAPHMSTDFNFEGIVGLSNCSGSLVKLEGSLDSDPAIVLTNGHCLETGMPAPGTVIFRAPSTRRFRILDANGERIGLVNSTMLEYATMTQTDMALYRLDVTYAQIRDRFQVQPLLLASQRAELNTPIEVISGYWRHGFRCAVEKFVHQLKEGNWVMSGSMRYSRPGCEVYGGTSGSPVIQAGTRTVVGVNNTGNEDGQRCTMNNPCEIDENGKVEAVLGYSYGQQTFWIYSCLNDQREIDLMKQGCMLPRAPFRLSSAAQ